MRNLVEINVANWDQVVVASSRPVLVDFWAPWCPFCRKLMPVFESLAPRYEVKLLFATVNVDQEPWIAEQRGILGIPTLKVFCQGRSPWERTGFHGETELRNELDRVLDFTPSCVANSTVLVQSALARPPEESLLTLQTIAIVGLSKDPEKESHTVARYLQTKGYRIIPVNPTAPEILGEKSYPSLLDIPDEVAKEIDVVNVFRPSDQVGPFVDQAIQLKRKFGTKPRIVWMQLGIENEAAAAKARGVGLQVVMNTCIAVTHRTLMRRRTT